MKRLGQSLLVTVFAALLLLSCRTLVAHPAEEAEASPPLLPMQGMLRSASEAVPAEELLAQELPGTASRRLLPGVTGDLSLPAGAPVRDGNGIPLGDRPYVRTVYTACRLEETSG